MLLKKKQWSAAFDRLVDEAYVLLRKPHTIETLGQTATTTLHCLLEDLFLPNYRYGKLSLPRSELLSTRTPIVPLTNQQADNMGAFITPLFDRFVIPHPADKTVSSFYSLDLASETREILKNYIPQDTLPTPQFPSVKLGETVGAAARCLCLLANKGETVLSSRSAIVVRNSQINEPHIGGLILHELTHVDDMQRDGPILYSTEPYRFASESRGYQASALGGHSLSIEIEEVRRRHADPSRPFVSTPELIEIIPASTLG